MKTFHRGRFSLGVVSIILGVVFPVAQYPLAMSPANWLGVGILILLGIVEIVLSRSHRFARWEEINKTDERNQLVRYRSCSAALRWTRWGCFVLILLAGYVPALTGNEALLDSVPGLVDALLLSLVIQLAAWLYYRAKT